MTASSEVFRAPTFDPPGAVPSDVRAQVWSVLAKMYPLRGGVERRLDDRFPYPRLARLTPLLDDKAAARDQTIMVACKQLSERGLGFFHPHPLPHRLAIVSLQRDENEWVELLLRMNWCRFIGHGWYESGGVFLRVAQDARSS